MGAGGRPLRSFVQVFYCSKNNGLSSRGCSAFLGWGAMSLRVQETVLRDEFACHDGAGGGGGPLLGGRGSVMPASRLAVFCPSLFAVFHRSPLAACLKVSRALRHQGLALTPFSPLPKLRERGWLPTPFGITACERKGDSNEFLYALRVSNAFRHHCM